MPTFVCVVTILSHLRLGSLIIWGRDWNLNPAGGVLKYNLISLFDLHFTKYVPLFVQQNVQNMIVANISDFRKDIKSYLDKVSQNFETLIINRNKDEGVVVISLEEYNSLMATNHELSSRKNESRLDAAIEKFKNGKSFTKDLIEP